MVRLFQLLAVVLLGAAAVFLWRQDYDTSFVTAVLGLCAFFLSVRFTFKPRVEQRQAERIKAAEEEEDDDDLPPTSNTDQ
jgi:hypothetical protein